MSADVRHPPNDNDAVVHNQEDLSSIKNCSLCQPLSVVDDNDKSTTPVAGLVTIGRVARIGMRGWEDRTRQGGETSIPRKTRRWCVRLVPPVVSDDEVPLVQPDDGSSSGQSTGATADALSHAYGGLVEVGAFLSTSEVEEDIAWTDKDRLLHEDKMLRMEYSRRASKAEATQRKVETSSEESTPSEQLNLTQSIMAVGKRLLAPVFDRPQKKRRTVQVLSSFHISKTAHFDPNDTHMAAAVVDSTTTSRSNSSGQGKQKKKNTEKGRDYNHFRLTGNAYRNKKQHPATRAVSLASMCVYDEMESALSGFDNTNDGDKSAKKNARASNQGKRRPIRVAYGDIGENFTIAGISRDQLRVGMKLRLGCPCSPTEKEERTSEAGDNVKKRIEVQDDGALHRDDDSSPIVEVCHVNNPCYRINNVPWSSRALAMVGGNMWGHHPGKHGWWWSPKLPLNDQLYPGGRGYLCKVVKGGIVHEGAVVSELKET